MERVLGRFPDVDGVFVYNDVMVFGELRALALAGRSVPDDITELVVRESA